MEKKLASAIVLVVLLLIITFLGFFIIKKPTITGIVTYEEIINTLNWTFDGPSDYIYDNNLINITNEKVTLIPNIIINFWNTSNEIGYVVEQAIYDNVNHTDKITVLGDGKRVKVNKVNIFDITFSDYIHNGDIINFYLTTDPSTQATNIYLCNANTSCIYPGYGAVYYNNTEGWYSIIVNGLDTPRRTFNIDPAEVNFDYINATHIETIENNSTNIIYPSSASIETKDFNIIVLSSFLSFHKNDLLNDQNIDYYYSIDSGNSWNSIPSNNNLSDVSISNNKIRIKADISTKGTETPIIYDFAVSYLTQVCNENWNLTYGTCLINNTKLKYYLDKNNCGTIDNLPADNGTFESCIYDNNVQNETNNIQNKTRFLFDERQESNVLLELITKGIANVSVSIVEYSTNSKNSTPSLTELGKYIDITADNATKNNLTSINIKIYYTDEEVANAGLDEETLKIHYFNETSNQWQALNSTVNSTGNYVEVTIEHLSTFGIFGSKQSSESSGSSSSSGSGGSSGGGGKTRIIKKIEEPIEQPLKEETKEIIEEEEIKKPKETKKECDYKISVSMPEHISFVEYDYMEGIINNIGGCEIESVDISISPELKDIIKIDKEKVHNIGINESVEFLLIKKLESKAANLIQGFNVKIPREKIKTYSGSLTFGALVQEQLTFEEKINIKVDLLEPISIIDIVSSKVSIFLIVSLLLVVVSYSFYVKRKRISELK